jgi:hypothetical protein
MRRRGKWGKRLRAWGRRFRLNRWWVRRDTGNTRVRSAGALHSSDRLYSASMRERKKRYWAKGVSVSGKRRMTYTGSAGLDRDCPRIGFRPGLLIVWLPQSVFWRRPAWNSPLRFSVLTTTPVWRQGSPIISSGNDWITRSRSARISSLAACKWDLSAAFG